MMSFECPTAGLFMCCMRKLIVIVFVTEIELELERTRMGEIESNRDRDRDRVSPAHPKLIEFGAVVQFPQAAIV